MHPKPCTGLPRRLPHARPPSPPPRRRPPSARRPPTGPPAARPCPGRTRPPPGPPAAAAPSIQPPSFHPNTQFCIARFLSAHVRVPVLIQIRRPKFCVFFVRFLILVHGAALFFFCMQLLRASRRRRCCLVLVSLTTGAQNWVWKKKWIFFDVGAAHVFIHFFTFRAELSL